MRVNVVVFTGVLAYVGLHLYVCAFPTVAIEIACVLAEVKQMISKTATISFI